MSAHFAMLAIAVRRQTAQVRRIQLGRKELVRNPRSRSGLTKGFKSVFAVADKVGIYSNGYNFLLDKNFRPLGTVYPIIEAENLNRQYIDHDETIFELFLSLNEEEKRKLKARLLNLEPEMLLFLRRLRQLDVKIGKRLILSHRCDKTTSPASISTNRPSGTTVTQYALIHRNWGKMPLNEKRNSGKTQTSLAFPFCASGPTISTQKIFAFLPLQSSSFFVSISL